MDTRPLCTASSQRYSEFGIAWIGLYCMAVVMGYGRFLFTATLPDIIIQLGLSTPMAGWLASINYIGYFIGAIVAMFVPRRHTWHALFIAAILSIVTTSILAIPDLSLAMWHIVRLLAGIASGVAMILGSSYVVQHFSDQRRAVLSTIHYSGIGVGIAASAAVTWLLLVMDYHFDTIWLFAAITSLPLLLLLYKIRPITSFCLARSPMPTNVKFSVNKTFLQCPRETDSSEESRNHSRLSAANYRPPSRPETTNSLKRLNSLSLIKFWLSQLRDFIKSAVAGRGYAIALLLISYGLAGFGYITSATFLPVMATQRIISEAGRGLNGLYSGLLIWLLVGVFATISNPLWGRIAQNIGEFKTLTGLILLQAIGMFLPIWQKGAIGLYSNAVILGATFVGIVSMTLGIIKEINPEYSNLLIGLATLAYAIGQFMGPLVTVALAGNSSNFSAGLMVAGIGLVIGLFLVLSIRFVSHSSR